MEDLQKQTGQADTFRDRFREVVTAAFPRRHRRVGEVSERERMRPTGVHQMDTERGSQDINSQEQAECSAAGTIMAANLVIHQDAFPGLSILMSFPNNSSTPSNHSKMQSF